MKQGGEHLGESPSTCASGLWMKPRRTGKLHCSLPPEGGGDPGQVQILLIRMSLRSQDEPDELLLAELPHFALEVVYILDCLKPPEISKPQKTLRAT